MASRKHTAEASDTTSSTVSGPVPRGERETTPAPSIAVESPSCRPTAMPPFDLSTLAGATTARPAAGLRVPLDLAVPLRTSATPPEDLSLRASFLLMHVDGQTSIAEIAGERGGSVAPTSGPRPTRR